MKCWLGARCCVGPLMAQFPDIGDGRGTAGVLDDPVGQPVDVEHLDTAADTSVLDEQGELGVESLGQVAGEGG